jgi:predicted RNA-binding Zn-ribbon protein involved in translation (DUF1610 family)
MNDVTMIAASYSWRCPECGQEHFERFVAERLTCPGCGSIFAVRSVEHRFRQEGAKSEGQDAHQAALL